MSVNENSKTRQPVQPKQMLGMSGMGWLLIIEGLACLVLAWTLSSVRNAHKIEFHRGFLSQMDVFIETAAGDNVDSFLDSVLDDLNSCAIHNEAKFYRKGPSFKYNTQLSNSQGARAFNICMKEKLKEMSPAMESGIYSKLVKALD